MSDQFTVEVLPTVQNYARLRFRGDDFAVVTCVSLAWYIWRSRREDFPASVYAHLAARQVAAGRDLPGCGTSTTDAITRATSGGGMDQLGDGPAADPLVVLLHRERLAVLSSTFADDTVKGEVLRQLRDGTRTLDVADEMGLSQARISQLRREFLEADEG